jgi:curved DNA-binding protein
MDYYKVLEINENASDTEIKKAYRSLSYKYHPDQNPDPAAGERMRDINEAYETLRDHDKRRQYDHSRQIQNVNPLENILNELFRNQPPMFSQMMRGHSPHINQPHANFFEFVHGGGQEIPIFFTHNMHHTNIPHNPHNQHNPHQNMHSSSTHNVEEITKPEPLELQLEITYENAYHGQQLPIQIERNIIQFGNIIRKEKEKIYVNIPKGTDQDEIIMISDKGNCVNQVYGDVKIQIKLSKHNSFERNGLNLIYIHTISFKESICGFETIITNLDGNSLKLKSSPGNVIQNRDEKIIKGKGFSRSSEVFGDLIVSFKVLPPKVLSERQIDLFSLEL